MQHLVLSSFSYEAGAVHRELPKDCKQFDVSAPTAKGKTIARSEEVTSLFE